MSSFFGGPQCYKHSQCRHDDVFWCHGYLRNRIELDEMLYEEFRSINARSVTSCKVFQFIVSLINVQWGEGRHPTDNLAELEKLVLDASPAQRVFLLRYIRTIILYVMMFFLLHACSKYSISYFQLASQVPDHRVKATRDSCSDCNLTFPRNSEVAKPFKLQSVPFAQIDCTWSKSNYDLSKLG